MKHSTAPKLVLFVDDDAAILEAFSRGFRHSSFTLCTATSGAEALKIMEENFISIIVSEYDIPNMKGTELLRICRERWPERLRILLNGAGNLDIALSAAFNGWVYQYVEKPIQIEELKSIITQAIWQMDQPYEPEYARLLFSPAAYEKLTIQMRVTASPERPTFAVNASPLDWAVDLCQSNQIPPELDRLRPLIDALYQISEITRHSENASDKSLSQIRQFIYAIA